MEDQRRPPPQQPPTEEPYEPPSVTVLGTIAELTRSNQSGPDPDFPMNSPSSF
jgi:hypothetical protein